MDWVRFFEKSPSICWTIHWWNIYWVVVHGDHNAYIRLVGLV